MHRSVDRLLGLLAACNSLFSARGLALLAMLLQLGLTADHLGATLLRELGRAGPDERLGLMQICTGEGVILVTADGRPAPAPTSGHDTATQCAVCVSASVCSFDTPSASAMPAFAANLVAPPVLSLREVASPVLRRAQAHGIRAPPVV